MRLNRLQHIGEIDDMGKKVREIENLIYNTLTGRITETHREFTANPDKFIFVTKNEFNVIANAKIKTISMGNQSIMAIIDYQGRRYIGIPESEYCEEFFSDSEDISDDEESLPDIINGIGILLFLSKVIDLRSNMTEMKIFDEILGIEESDSITCSEFIEKVEEYRVCAVGSKLFDIIYNEDAKRLLCALVCKKNNQDDLYNYIYEFMMLESSRSVVDILYSVTELNNEELIYLQIYRALEYLFIIIRAKDYSDGYDIPVDKTVDLIINENIRFSEQSSVQLLVEKSSTTSKTDYCDYLATIGIDASDKDKQVEVISRYIYEQRCKIAHYKYKHEPLKDLATLHQSSVCLLKLIISLFQHMSNTIITINKDNNLWEELVTRNSI